MAETTEREDHREGLQYPDWQKAVQEALLELDQEKLRSRVAAAEAAIFNRLQAIAHDANHLAERHAMEGAASNLRVVKREILKFPDWE